MTFDWSSFVIAFVILILGGLVTWVKNLNHQLIKIRLKHKKIATALRALDIFPPRKRRK